MKKLLNANLLAVALLVTLTAVGCAAPANEAARAGEPKASEAEASKAEPLSDEVTDAVRHLAVRTALLGELGTDALGISIEVEGHEATLTGEVSQRSTQELAKEVAVAVEGIETVNNHLEVAPPEEPSETPAADVVAEAEREVRDAILETRVKSRLLTEIGRYATQVEVEATDGVVSLRGHLPDDARRDLALETAESTSGVEEVVDLLRVR